MTEDPASSSPRHTYSYDADGLLFAVDGGSTGKYDYDSLDHRTSATNYAGTFNPVFDAFGRHVSYWSASNALEEADVYTDGEAIAFRSGGLTHFQHQNWVGTERMRTSYQGAVEVTDQSLPWGDGLVKTATVGSALAAQQNFATLDQDSETLTEHASFRQYADSQGHWLSPDPYLGSYDFTNPQTFNRYSYALNDPINNLDPSGLDDCYDGDGDQGCDPGGCLYSDPCGGDPSGDPTDPGNSGNPADPCAGADACVTATPGTPPGTTGPVVVVQLGFGVLSNVVAPSNAATPNPCQATLLNMANQQLGTNFNSSNVAGSYMNGTAYNIIIQSNQLTAGQFNNIQLGRYTTSGLQYFTGAGLAGHIADETNLGFAQSAFQSSNVGGNLSVSFAFHDDHGYANNPIGALIHFFTDVLGHNTRKPC